MIGRRFLPLFLSIILLALATSPLLAQDALTQTEQAVDADGTTITVSFPAGWKSMTGNQGILLATSASALDELNKTGLVTSAGETGMIISLPNFMDNLSLPHDAPAEQAVSTYLKAAQLNGAKVETSTDFSVPAATAVVTPTGQTTLRAMIGALQFPGGTSIIGVVPASAVDATVTAILQSVTLQAPGDTPVATPVTNSDLPQSEHITDDTGLTVTVHFPAGWVANVTSQGIMLASSEDAMKQIQQSGSVTTKGEVGMVVSGSSELDRVHVALDLPADETLKAYIEANQGNGDIEASADFSVPAATSQLTIPGGDISAFLGALTFPEGPAIFIVIPSSGVNAEVMSVLNSITLEAPADIPAATPDPSVSLTSTSFNVPEPKGAYALTIGLPDGWVTNYSDHGGLLYLGNSDSALGKASAPNVTFAPGEIALTIALPRAVAGLGIPPDADPTEAISHFQSSSKAQGRVVTDDSFAVPAAHAHLTGGNLPDGGGDVYMLKFDQGLVFIVVQPSGAIDGTIAAMLQSIQVGTPEDTTASPTAIATQLSADKTTTISVTQPNGAFDLSFDLPDGWLAKQSEGGTTINIGSSAEALRKASATTETLAEGEIGLQIGLPELVTQLGLAFDTPPTDTINGFINVVKGKGNPVEDGSFSVPAAHGTIQTDIIPGGGAELYALAFEGGTLLVAVQPMGVSDAELTSLLQSIRFEPSSGTSAPATPISEATALPAATATPATAKALRQWAASATATSQYGDDDWSASQVVGKPNTEICADSVTAWASASSTERAVLRVQFDKPVLPSQINIYQSFTPGAIVEVDLGSAVDATKVLPLRNSADPVGNTECPGVFTLDITGVDNPVDFIVIYVDQSLTGNWDEIDAVELVGTPAS